MSKVIDAVKSRFKSAASSFENMLWFKTKPQSKESSNPSAFKSNLKEDGTPTKKSTLAETRVIEFVLPPSSETVRSQLVLILMLGWTKVLDILEKLTFDKAIPFLHVSMKKIDSLTPLAKKLAYSPKVHGLVKLYSSCLEQYTRFTSESWEFVNYLMFLQQSFEKDEEIEKTELIEFGKFLNDILRTYQHPDDGIAHEFLAKDSRTTGTIKNTIQKMWYVFTFNTISLELLENICPAMISFIKKEFKVRETKNRHISFLFPHSNSKIVGGKGNLYSSKIKATIFVVKKPNEIPWIKFQNELIKQMKA